MKKLHSKKNILLGFSFCIILAITAMAFQDSSKINKPIQKTLLDTLPNNDFDIDINIKGLDETMKKSLEMVEKSMKEIDWSKMSKQIEQSMKNIDMAKMELDIKKSMKDIDWNKMKLEIDRSMKEIDIQKLQLDIEKEVKDGMKNFNTEEMKKSIEEMKKSMEELKKINFDDLKKEMDNVKKELELNKDHFKIDMEKLNKEMQKVKEGLAEVKEMTTEMERDGLINNKETNTIEYRNNELLINGKKQSPEVTEKYRKYFKGDNFNFKFNN